MGPRPQDTDDNPRLTISGDQSSLVDSDLQAVLQLPFSQAIDIDRGQLRQLNRVIITNPDGESERGAVCRILREIDRRVITTLDVWVCIDDPQDSRGIDS